MVSETLLDVRELEAPEPLQAVLGVLETMQEHHYLRVLHRRDPHCLYPLLDQLGFVHEIRDIGDSTFELFIWNRSDQLAALAVHRAVHE